MILLAALVATASVRGVVRDTECLPLPGVTVVLRGDARQRTAVTGAAGEFAFEDVPDAPYTLRAWMQGFQALSRDGVRPAANGEPVSLMLPLGFGTVVDRVVMASSSGNTPESVPGLSVRVLDDRCQPVAHAAVALTDGPRVSTMTTDDTGRASLPLLDGGRYSLIVTAPRFSQSALSADTTPRGQTEILMPLFRGPPESRIVFEPVPSRFSLMDPVTQPRIRIVAIGDSTTAGTPAFKSPREAPPAGEGNVTSQYAYWLMQAHPDWEVVNQGVNGERSDTIAARFDEDVIALKAAVVVIVAGVNDVYQGRDAQHVEEQLATMYRKARAAGLHVVAGTIIPYNTATPDQNARMHEINAWIRTQADAGVVTFVDTRAAVAAPGNADMLASSPDGLHPDAAGYRRMADAIAPAIERAVR